MSNPHDLQRDAVLARAADGSPVVVLSLSQATSATDLNGVVEYAQARSARAVWVFGGLIEPALDFRRTGGYLRLEASAPPDPLFLPAPPSESVRELQTICFARVWGRYEPVSWDPSTRYVGLHEKGRWVGICQLDAIAGWIDGPGVHPMLRSPERSAQLLRGAAAFLPRNRPVTLETWGESAETIEAYRALGFEVAEELTGWELRL